jgi:hypothetical protein
MSIDVWVCRNADERARCYERTRCYLLRTYMLGPPGKPALEGGPQGPHSDRLGNRSNLPPSWDGPIMVSELARIGPQRVVARPTLDATCPQMGHKYAHMGPPRYRYAIFHIQLCVVLCTQPPASLSSWCPPELSPSRFSRQSA